MKTKINEAVNDWTRVKNHCRTTDNKEFTEKEPSEDFKRKLLISEHSPIRLLEFDWTWKSIPYWVSTEWSRHKFEKFISTQRDDRTKDSTPRGKKPQESPVNFDGYANMQNLIDAWRKRLCYKATPEARKLAEDMKVQLAMRRYESESAVLVPNCVYRGGCPEFTTCGYWDSFLDWVKRCFPSVSMADISDITTRYSLYNLYFFEHQGQKIIDEDIEGGNENGMQSQENN